MSEGFRDTAITEPTPPVDVLVAYENPTGIICNVRSVLALLRAEKREVGQ